MQLVKVVVGVVKNPQQQILIAKRPPQVIMPGYWEFPGGKMEAFETYEQALARELHEEIDIIPQRMQFLMQQSYERVDKLIELNVFLVQQFMGEAVGKEGQEVRWVMLEEFIDYEFLPSNDKLLTFLQENAHLLL